jgi:hypothetical protein
MKFNLLEWSYNARKIAPPHIIVWKLFWYVPYKISLAIACMFCALGFGLDSASELWEQGS